MEIVHFNNDGVEYFQLYIPCPVCIEHGWPTEKSHWTHGDSCGGDIYVGDNAWYYCKQCGHTSPVMNWMYKCPNHGSNDGEQYLSISDGKYLINALTVAGEIATEAGVKWFRRFTAALDDYLDEH